MRETILAAISEVTGRPFPASVINGETSVYELGIDSMSLVELIFKLEAELQIDIPLAELNESIFESLDSLTAYLNGRKQAAAEAGSLAAADAVK
ncbi:acyl carrier protein [Paraburkholderia sp. D15]|uniref:acyl carrier protein n=1 Tax=Paraburkholderia sp. D15 TaxID=2880218 RepID=UPI00247AAAA1|nr:acyl carrier protein [Paraburkholderia sp. D15]WGS52278.1 acyl carrier protein [Paraburkholderia sp. D15]